MKKLLLSLSLLLGIAGGAAAQGSCAITLTKSGTGTTRTYTASSTGSSPSFYIKSSGPSSWGGIIDYGSSSTNTLTLNYTYGAVYSIFAQVTDGSCGDSVLIEDTVSGPVNYYNSISAITYRDSTGVPLTYTPTVKTWLIKKDNIAGTLTAVDSQINTLLTSQYNYYASFHTLLNPGTYLVKSHIINQPVGASTGYLPTYCNNQPYWNSADTFVLTSNSSLTSHSLMLSGTPTTGPGFIGGLISAGANKGTAEGDPVAGINILLRNAQGKAIKMATTGADGKFAFSNLAAGMYTVYPEELNFSTTPSDAINVTPAQNRMAVNFKRNASAKEYVPGAVLGVGTMDPLAYSISPNPASDKLQINLGRSTGKVTTTLSNATGQVVMQEVINGSNATLSVNQLPAGMYLLQLQNGKEVRTEKVQIQR